MEEILNVLSGKESLKTQVNVNVALDNQQAVIFGLIIFLSIFTAIYIAKKLQ